MDSVTDLLVSVRASLYATSPEKLNEISSMVAPGFEAKGAGKPKKLSVVEDYIANLHKEEDGGREKLGLLLESLESTAFRTPSSEKEVVHIGSYKKDLKISGQIGDIKNGLNFISYVRQVEAAGEKGYSEKEIIDAVIRAIQPGSRLRSYLEGRELLDLVTLNSIVRSFYQEKTPTEWYQQLCGLTQDSKESPQEFLFRALDIRQKVIFASKDKTSLSYDPVLVQNMFRHAVSTGLRDDVIRSEYQSTLSKGDVSDEVLVQDLNAITARETERKAKIDTSRKAKVMNVSEEKSAPVTDITKEPKPGKLQLELEELRTQVASLQKELENRKPDTSTRGKRSRPIRACENCRSTGERCDHCFRCGSSEHWQRGCRKPNLQGNDQRPN